MILDLLSQAQRIGASDLHLSSNHPALWRLEGALLPVLNPVLNKLEQIISHEVLTQEINDLLDQVSQEQRDSFKIKKNLDFSYEFHDPDDPLGGKLRCRMNIYQHQNGLALASRLIPSTIPNLEDLNSPEIFKKLLGQSQGLILITGPTGSGKTTTLAAMINYLNQHQGLHVISIEDPIEFVHVSHHSLIHQRELKAHTESFDQALKSCLREDPDVIVIGELRDLETIKLALTAAETGHLVLASLHTNSAAKTLDRVLDVFPGDEKAQIRAMFSESLSAVISQVLVKKIAGGRVAAYEILINTSAVSYLIRENKIPQIYNAIQTGQAYGMQTKEQALQKLIHSGLIHAEETRH